VLKRNSQLTDHWLLLHRGGVPLRCQHKAHWWPHWRLCWRRYMLYGTCRYHGRKCIMGCTKKQVEYNINVIAQAYKNNEIPRIKVRRRDDQDDGAHGA
jgi:hypothetical protein